MQINLVINYRSYRKKNKIHNEILKLEIGNGSKIPFITIQLPVYNEMYVANRLIEVVSKIRYPKDRFEIQVLDDSDDETVDLIMNIVELKKELGFNISHIRREERKGFKAGALEEGLKSAKGEFIAIFDADFVPDPDFLLYTLPYFKDENIGMIQTRWGHINRKYSSLTRLQAFALDAHFSVEHAGRSSAGHFVNFNGTAGIWRKKCIEEAGGWEHDTLTEDLDLSFRAQLKKWKFKYIEDIISPAELPVVMTALKNQQYRWNKGGAENFRKLGRKIWKQKSIPLKTRLHAIFQLLNSSVFLCVFATAILSIPVLFIKHLFVKHELLFDFSSLFLISLVILIIFYWYSYRMRYKNKLLTILTFSKDFIFFLSVAMGLSFHNSIAVIEGHLGKRSSFIRTPKFNIQQLTDKWKGKKYVEANIGLVSIIEGLLSIYFLFGIVSAFFIKEYGLLPFHLMLFGGFMYVFLNTVLIRNK